MIKAVIFDMNGVIINDEAVHEDAIVDVCRKYGIKLSHDDYYEMCLGRTDYEGFAKIIERFKLKDIDISKLMMEKQQKYFEMLPGSIRQVPRAIDMIRKLSPHFRLGLVSSASRNEIDFILKYFKVIGKFQVIISGDDVNKGKPDPEPYLMASLKLNELPRNCVAIEDSVSGIRSAKNAGMECIAITTSHRRENLKEADYIIDSFDEMMYLKLFKSE